VKFQAESKKSGDKFEAIVLDDLSRMGFKKIRKNVILEELGIEIDFVHKGYGDTTVYVEAKGGEAGESKRPGAKRTDNVKKAIANGALLKFFYPSSQYVVYFSDLPKKNGASDKMLRKAIEAGYIDSVRYLIQMIR